jgi:hypothetical protein
MGNTPVVTDAPQPAPVGETCPVCGRELVTGTVDLAQTPDRTEDLDLPRAELQPGQMVQASVCPDPDCPGPDAGAEV